MNPTDHPTGLDQLVPYWVGRLALAIGNGTFKDEVSKLLQTTMIEAYNRGLAEGKKK
jgi:hypothetical protein